MLSDLLSIDVVCRKELAGNYETHLLRDMGLIMHECRSVLIHGAERAQEELNLLELRYKEIVGDRFRLITQQTDAGMLHVDLYPR